MVSLGAKVVAVVKPATPTVDVKAAAVGTIQAAAAARVSSVVAGVPTQRLSVHKTVRADGGADAREAPAPVVTDAPAPAVIVSRTTAPRAVFVLRGQKHGGGSVCQEYATQDACTSECTSMLRGSSMTKPGPEAVVQCSCTELDGGC